MITKYFKINKITDDGVSLGVNFEQGIGCEATPGAVNCEIEAHQHNRYFTRFEWSPDSSWFLSIWVSRDATQSKALACRTSTLTCEQAGQEDGGVKGHWDDQDHWVNDPESNGSGWVGSFRKLHRFSTVKSYEICTNDSKNEIIKDHLNQF